MTPETTTPSTTRQARDRSPIPTRRVAFDFDAVDERFWFGGNGLITAALSALSATFPDEILENNGKTVKLVGFMLPLETKPKQQHFVLTSHPPDCFYHVPGGPAGSVEVFANKPLEASFGPLALEGRLETLETSETDVLYRLHDARALEPPRKPAK